LEGRQFYDGVDHGFLSRHAHDDGGGDALIGEGRPIHALSGSLCSYRRNAVDLAAGRPNTCVMASVFQHQPATPRHAFRRRTRLDRLLDPDVLKALGEPTRARILSCLLKCGRPCSVTEIAECCSIDFSMVARHLSTMARAGVLSSEKKGRTVWYAADGAALAASFRELADAIDELAPSAGLCEDPACACQMNAPAKGTRP